MLTGICGIKSTYFQSIFSGSPGTWKEFSILEEEERRESTLINLESEYFQEQTCYFKCDAGFRTNSITSNFEPLSHLSSITLFTVYTEEKIKKVYLKTRFKIQSKFNYSKLLTTLVYLSISSRHCYRFCCKIPQTGGTNFCRVTNGVVPSPSISETRCWSSDSDG